VCISAYLFQIFGIKKIFIVFSESFACVTHLSLSGKILYRIVDKFFVQWNELTTIYKKAIYTGRLSNINGEVLKTKKSNRGFVFVTVGSTSFDSLIKEIDNEQFILTLKRKGYTGLHIQHGNGKHSLSMLKDILDFDIDSFKYKSSLIDEIKQSSLVISHEQDQS